MLYCLDASRLTQLAESAIGRLPLQKHRRPDAIAKIAKPPVFGRQLYELIGSSKIVLNGAIDMAGQDRGNMRCFEAMGCGALLVSDAGSYPDGMSRRRNHRDISDDRRLSQPNSTIFGRLAAAKQIADNGRKQISNLYSKERQWALFDMVVESL